MQLVAANPIDLMQTTISRLRNTSGNLRAWKAEATSAISASPLHDQRLR